MSASLVGSEMCIRDRGKAGHPGTKAPPPAPAPSALWPRKTDSAGGDSLCLLYTSDAADDM
eukprot:13122212-Alexandrium_andersonii.AAC.1